MGQALNWTQGPLNCSFASLFAELPRAETFPVALCTRRTSPIFARFAWCFARNMGSNILTGRWAVCLHRLGVLARSPPGSPGCHCRRGTVCGGPRVGHLAQESVQLGVIPLFRLDPLKRVGCQAKLFPSETKTRKASRKGQPRKRDNLSHGFAWDSCLPPNKCIRPPPHKKENMLWERNIIYRGPRVWE